MINLLKILPVKKALTLPQALFIDLRSPLEYSKGFIPGALNMPLFDNEEREVIGILYRKDEWRARLKGIDIASGKILKIVEETQKFADKKLVFYCWRGGLRSKSIHALLEALELDAFRLQGGYKAYRRFILDQLDSYQLSKPVFVLNGLTGVGKTEVLHALRQRGCPTIDLEDLACHRGSLFGHLGIKKNPCQRQFDALLWNRLEELNDKKYIIMEGEGKRIGSVYQPDFLYQAIQEGEHILLTAPLTNRVERLLKEYTPPSATGKKEIEEAILTLKKYLGTVKTKHLLFLLEQKDYRELIYQLCQYYYDRLYNESKPGKTSFVLTVDSSNSSKAAEEIHAFIEKKIEKQFLTPVTKR